MTNIHFLEMIHQFDDIIQTHVLLQLQEETDMASRLVVISYLEMEMPGNRSKDILKLSVFINQWELGKTWIPAIKDFKMQYDYRRFFMGTRIAIGRKRMP